MMLSCKVSPAMHNAFRAGARFPPFPKLSYASMLTYMYWVLPPSLLEKTETDIGCVKAKLGQGEKECDKKNSQATMHSGST